MNLWGFFSSIPVNSSYPTSFMFIAPKITVSIHCQDSWGSSVLTSCGCALTHLMLGKAASVDTPPLSVGISSMLVILRRWNISPALWQWWTQVSTSSEGCAECSCWWQLICAPRPSPGSSFGIFRNYWHSCQCGSPVSQNYFCCGEWAFCFQMGNSWSWPDFLW